MQNKLNKNQLFLRVKKFFKVEDLKKLYDDYVYDYEVRKPTYDILNKKFKDECKNIIYYLNSRENQIKHLNKAQTKKNARDNWLKDKGELLTKDDKDKEIKLNIDNIYTLYLRYKVYRIFSIKPGDEKYRIDITYMLYRSKYKEFREVSVLDYNLRSIELRYKEINIFNIEKLFNRIWFDYKKNIQIDKFLDTEIEKEINNEKTN